MISCRKLSEVTSGIAAGPSAADANWCPNSAKHQAFWGGARHNIKQEEGGGNESLVISPTLTFSCSCVGGVCVVHDNKSWDIFPPGFFQALLLL